MCDSVFSMSANSPDQKLIEDSFSIALYRWKSFTAILDTTWPNESDFICKQLNGIILSLEQLKRAFENRTSFTIGCHQQHFIGDIFPPLTMIQPGNIELTVQPYSSVNLEYPTLLVDNYECQSTGIDLEYLTNSLSFDILPGNGLTTAAIENTLPGMESGEITSNGPWTNFVEQGNAVTLDQSCADHAENPTNPEPEVRLAQPHKTPQSSVERVLLPRPSTARNPVSAATTRTMLNQKDISLRTKTNQRPNNSFKRPLRQPPESDVNRSLPLSLDHRNVLLHKFIDLLGSNHDEQLNTMYRLYSAIGSQEAISQLENGTVVLQEQEQISTTLEVLDIRQIVRTLDKLDIVHQSTNLVRRIMLLRLAEYRELVMQELQNGRETDTRLEFFRQNSKPEATAIDVLTMRAYKLPQPTEINVCVWRESHDKQRKSLRNRLDKARNWCRAVEDFGIGFIALVPTGGDFGIQNSDFEQLTINSCSVLLHVLKSKQDGLVEQISSRFTPLIQAMYKGTRPLPKLTVGL